MRYDRIILTVIGVFLVIQILAVTAFAISERKLPLEKHVTRFERSVPCDDDRMAEGFWETRSCSSESSLCGALSMLDQNEGESCLSKRLASIKKYCPDLIANQLPRFFQSNGVNRLNGIMSNAHKFENGMMLNRTDFKTLAACHFGFESVGFEKAKSNGCLLCRNLIVDYNTHYKFGWADHFRKLSSVLIALLTLFLFSVFLLYDRLSVIARKWLTWIGDK